MRREVEHLLTQQTSNPDGFDPSAGASLLVKPAVAQVAPGSQLGHYRILSLLGAGGMGQVYKAFDARLCREVAVKVAGERLSERFDREACAIAALNHPNICTVYDVGPNYLVMELVDGETLPKVLRKLETIEQA